MAALSGLEKSLDNIFGKNAPKLPPKGKEVLVEWLPWINLVFGVFTLWTVYWLWHWAHLANGLINYANSLGQAYGVDTGNVHRLGATVWLGLIVLAVEAILYLMAFAPTRQRAKRGWDLMFYALLINVVYGVISIFTDYGGFGSFLGKLVGSAIGLWLLFQIRDKYLGHKAGKTPTKTV